MPVTPADRRARALFGAVLHLYPASYRDEYGREMTLVLLDRLRAEQMAAGRAVLFAGAIVAVLVDAPRQHAHILAQDLRLALRLIRRERWFATVAIGTVAIGIALSTAVFSVGKSLLVDELPYREADRAALVWVTNPRQGFDRDFTSYPRLLAWRERSQLIEAFAGYTVGQGIITGIGDPEQRCGERVQHGRHGTGRPQRIVRLPARAARTPRSVHDRAGDLRLGWIAGALLLLALPPGVFEAVVPWLILITSILVGTQPWISRRLRARRGTDAPDRVHLSPLTTAWATLTGVYGGYFGAGSGVMMMAVLGFGTDLDLKIVNALKTLAVMAANVVATVIFLVLADLDWLAIGLLAGGSVVGGYVGSHIGRRLPCPEYSAPSWSWSGSPPRCCSSSAGETGRASSCPALMCPPLLSAEMTSTMLAE